MKSMSSDFITNETAMTRKPEEIYHFYDNASANHRYTTCQTEVEYDGNIYTPKPIERGTIKFDEKPAVTVVKLRIPYGDEPVENFLFTSPAVVYWVDIMKVHLDMSPLEANVIFTGMFRSVTFKGNTVEVEVASIEQFFKKNVPVYRYQRRCNRTLYGTGCGVDKTAAANKTATTVTPYNKGRTLFSTDFGSREDGFFTRGWIESSGKSPVRVTDHTGNYVTVMVDVGLADGDAVTAYAGCDGKASTCRDKFDNLYRFLGFPYIPYENPALRIP